MNTAILCILALCFCVAIVVLLWYVFRLRLQVRTLQSDMKRRAKKIAYLECNNEFITRNNAHLLSEIEQVHRAKCERLLENILWLN
jgi:cell division protein FtsB